MKIRSYGKCHQSIVVCSQPGSSRSTTNWWIPGDLEIPSTTAWIWVGGIVRGESLHRSHNKWTWNQTCHAHRNLWEQCTNSHHKTGTKPGFKCKQHARRIILTGCVVVQSFRDVVDGFNFIAWNRSLTEWGGKTAEMWPNGTSDEKRVEYYYYYYHYYYYRQGIWCVGWTWEAKSHEKLNVNKMNRRRIALFSVIQKSMRYSNSFLMEMWFQIVESPRLTQTPTQIMLRHLESIQLMMIDL